MSAVTVRFARPGDAPAIHGFIVGLAMHVGHPDEVEVTPEALARQLESERPPFECLLAEIDGKAVGSAIFFANYIKRKLAAGEGLATPGEKWC